MSYNDSTPKTSSMEHGVSAEPDLDQALIMLALNVHVCEAARTTVRNFVKRAGTHTEK